ncbi:MAG: hypothetical protein ACOYNY_11655 [Caldilineaceae bacterium]
MGVYHFMGLGLSVGAVSAAISYLGARRQRWNPVDQTFFALSGERGQKLDDKPGDIEALVLFSTADIRTGREISRDYILNRPGTVSGSDVSGQRISEMLRKVLPSELIATTERTEVSLYWCDVMRDDPVTTFERVMAVLLATKSPGRMGKEIWINLTGGNNIINSALNLSASLTGMPARMYYLLSTNDACLRHTVPERELGTDADHFWVEPPIPYIAFNPNHRALLRLLEEEIKGEAIEIDFVLDWLQNVDDFGSISGDTRQEKLKLFRRLYIVPLRAQRLLDLLDDNTIRLGTAWPQFKRYYEAMVSQTNVMDQRITLAQLAKDANWFHEEILKIR